MSFELIKGAEDSNRSANPALDEVSDPARRQVIRGSLGTALAAVFGPLAALAQSGCAAGGRGSSLLGFKGIPATAADGLVVPEGYRAEVLFRWGDPVGIAGDMPAFRSDASNSAAEQAVQAGMHHDGMHFYPLPAGGGRERALLVMNHEYTDEGLLHPDGYRDWTADKVAKSQAAHGVSVIEIERADGAWQVVRPSPYARRITAATPTTVSGPAAGHRLLATAADPAGTRVLGTFNNCASGRTPWGTYLTCEENFAFYFHAPDQVDAHQRRWGLADKRRALFPWGDHDPRFDARRHPNEFNRFGWVVEIDPFDPSATPIKRTALGRAAREGATTVLTRDGRAVVYMGEDARFEYIYKFVSRDAMRPGGFAANRGLLDHGTLYVARFDAGGRGVWLPLVHGANGLTAGNGFADQGEVAVKARQASDRLGGTRMDRPEWIVVDPFSGEVYCTLTNNALRGQGGQPAADPANPRNNNTMGQIIRWKEHGDFDATTFAWNHLVLAGDPQNARAEARGNIRGDIFACPDGLSFDARGVLWVQTDAHASQMYKGEFERIGNNQMLACDVATGEMRRFLTGPVNCEVTGAVSTPDCRTLFVNIQHPGETPSDRSDPANPMRFSRWPDGAGRPRSATVAIRRIDGGIVGT
ncbi:MAG: PhoX family phosphatase [Burkholderiales bacterium]|nr:PhoX family phosphatase [Burkholderiales bacterium]